MSLPDASRRLGEGDAHANTPPVIHLPRGLTGTKADPATIPPVQRGVAQVAALPPLRMPPPSDRVAAIGLVRESKHGNFLLKLDGHAPRLLSRAEALHALEADDTPHVILLPLSDDDAEALGLWLDKGQPVDAPQAWLADLEQSAVSRAQRHDRRQAELERVRAERDKLRDGLYRMLLGDKAPARKPHDATPDP